jgi:hypothetical protein
MIAKKYDYHPTKFEHIVEFQGIQNDKLQKVVWRARVFVALHI